MGEQILLLNKLQSVGQASKFEPIKLVFARGHPLMLDGFNDADKLVEELARHIRTDAQHDSAADKRPGLSAA